MGLTGSVVNARPTSNSKTITAIWPARARMEISPLKSAVSASGKNCSMNPGYPTSGLNVPGGLATRHHQAILILELQVDRLCR